MTGTATTFMFRAGKAEDALVRNESWLLRIVVVLASVKLALLFLFAATSRFVMDELGQLGFAKYLGHELFRTLWPAKAVGFQIFIKLAHLIGWDAVSIVLIGRIQTALLGCAILAMIYACARLLGQDRLRALVIVLVLLSFSNFIERILPDDRRAAGLVLCGGGAPNDPARGSPTANDTSCWGPQRPFVPCNAKGRLFRCRARPRVRR